MARTDVSKFYNDIIENVIGNVKEEFENEGVDEQILEELKQIWKTKLIQSRSLESHEPRYTTAASNANLSQVAAARNYLKQDIGSAGKQRTVEMARTHQPLSGPAEMASIAIQNVSHINLPTELTQQTIALPQTAGGQQPVYRCYQVGEQLVYAIEPPTMQQVQAAVLQQQQQLQQHQQQQQRQQLSGAASQATSAAISQTLQQVQVQSQAQPSSVLQVDGGNDSSSEDDDFGDDDDEEDDAVRDDEDGDEDGDDQQGDTVQEEPLNSDDDDSGDEPEDIFDTDNVIVCQYEKINRTRNRWKFHLKDGIMNLEGKDWVFHRGMGEADW